MAEGWTEFHNIQLYEKAFLLFFNGFEPTYYTVRIFPLI